MKLNLNTKKFNKHDLIESMQHPQEASQASEKA